jgi:hypothetical protein
LRPCALSRRPSPSPSFARSRPPSSRTRG